MLTMQTLRAAPSAPKFFGLGFIQLKLSEEERLHFYHPSLTANVPEEELHDHRYDFRSKVLAGSLTNEIWTFTSDPKGEQELVKVSCEPGVPVPADMKPVVGRAAKALSFETIAGAEYTIGHDQFHRVYGQECITHIQRQPKAKPFASVIRGTGADHVCPFGVEMSTAECWDLIGEMVGEVAKPGYHVRQIARGVLGEASKILEEAEEFRDALEQGVELMALIELSDMQGAIRAYLQKHHPSLTMDDLRRMNDVTRRAFENGHRA